MTIHELKIEPKEELKIGPEDLVLFTDKLKDCQGAILLTIPRGDEEGATSTYVNLSLFEMTYLSSIFQEKIMREINDRKEEG